MDPREELEALRRMAELEAKAGGSSLPKTSAKANSETYDPAAGMNPLEKALVGVGSTFNRAYLGVRSLLPGGELTQQEKDDLAVYERNKQHLGGWGTAGEIGGDIALSALPGGAVTKATKAAPLLARTLSQLGLGAGYGALTSPEDRTGGALGGAVGTGVGMAANRVVGGAIKPFITKDAEALMAQGVQPTIGQAMGGAVNQAEQKLKSVYGVGDLIRGARNRAVDEFNEKAIQTAVPGSKGFGDEALIAAREALGKQYDDVLSKLPKITMDKSAIMSTATQAAGDASLGLNNNSKKFIQDYVAKNLIGRSQDVTGETAKRVESDLLKVITRLRSSSDSEQRGIAEALGKVHDAWRTSLAQTAEAAQPGAGKALGEANAAWRAFSALDRAGGYRGNQNLAAGDVAGRFTPNSLRRSIEVSDVTQNNNATRALRGGNSPFERLNTLTRQGEKVLGESVPDSGTAGRMLVTGLLGAGGSMAGVEPTSALGAALLAAPAYSRTGSKFLMQGVTPMYESAIKALSLRGVPTQTIDEALRKYGPEGVISLARSIGVNTQQ